jgi:hypothetical protein
MSASARDAMQAIGHSGRLGETAPPPMVIGKLAEKVAAHAGQIARARFGEWAQSDQMPGRFAAH